MTHQESKEGGLRGVVEVKKLGSVSGYYETGTHAFSIEFDDGSAVRTCEVVDSL